MAEPTEYFFILNGMEGQAYRGLFRLQDHAAPPGGALRIAGQPDSAARQFSKGEAELFLDGLPPQIRSFFFLSKTATEIKKEHLAPPPPPKGDRQDVPNATEKDYPDGDLPNMPWNRPQVLAWLRDNDEKLLRAVMKKPKLTVEDMVLMVWAEFDPSKRERYLARK